MHLNILVVQHSTGRCDALIFRIQLLRTGIQSDAKHNTTISLNKYLQMFPNWNKHLPCENHLFDAFFNTPGSQVKTKKKFHKMFVVFRRLAHLATFFYASIHVRYDLRSIFSWVIPFFYLVLLLLNSHSNIIFYFPHLVSSLMFI